MPRIWTKKGGNLVPLDGGNIPPPPIPTDHPPVARVAVSPTTGNVPLTVSVDASTSTDDHGITSYAFDFGDGTTAAASSASRVNHVYATAGSYTASVTVTDTSGQTTTARTTLTATTKPPPGTSLWVPGISSSYTGGINAGWSSKKADVLQRTNDMASRIGITGAQLRGQMAWHFYQSGSPVWDPTKMVADCPTWAKTNGFGNICANMKTNDMGTWAAGGFDANFRSYLAGWSAMNFPGHVIIIIEHEPESPAPQSQAASDNWSQGTARFMKIAYEHNDPKIVYSTCHIPGAAGQVRLRWNARPPLNALYGGDTVAAQRVMDRTLCGLDPYPDVNPDGSLDTLLSRCAEAIADFKSVGFTRFYLPEVAFFNYIGNKDVGAGNVGPLTEAGKAARLHRELWVWARANAIEGFNYYDVAGTGYRTPQRALSSPEQQTEYAKIATQTA